MAIFNWVKKNVYLFFITSTILTLNAQQFTFNSPINKPTESVYVKSNMALNSNLPQTFINKFIYGGEINNADKLGVESKLKRYNNFVGFESINSLGYTFKKKNNKLNYFIEFSNKQFYSLQINENLYKLILNGNKPYAGSVLNLNENQYKNLQYNQLSVGYQEVLTDGKLMVGFSLGIPLGYNYQAAGLLNGYVYTPTSGSYINTEGSIYSQSVMGKPFNIKGAGLAFGLNTCYKHTENLTFDISVQDFGFISWFKAKENFTRTGSYNFEGVNIANLTKFETPNTQSLKDSIQKAFPSDSLNNRFTTSTPALIAFNINAKINSQLALNTGFNYRTVVYQIPTYYLGLNYKIANGFNVWVNAAYGGYGNYNTSVGTEFFFKKPNLYLLLGATQIEGVLKPNTKSGMGLTLNIKKNL